ncbi:uncharacterized protein LOC116416083 [Nasonia vitripennis]|uniref:Double jelly roll-like domain-containing protein n=1 Tax=Nasonia vitripennis TaxID=7425 RepID=A0A7M7PY33_NASVI|nr:uncharacterized protein LOC116416083 [Nasonia vitripennis]
MDEILSIQSPVSFDESLVHYELHAHQPYTVSSYNNSDEIRIAIQHQDLSLLPSRSSLHICGKLTKPNGTALARTKLVNNAICHMFEEIRYEMNAVEINRCKNVGLTTVMKGWISHNPSQSLIMENAGWLDIAETKSLTNASGYFDVNIPLSMIFGFAEDYRKIVVNVKHELVLTRSRNDLNAIIQTATLADGVATFEEYKLELTKIEWLMPYVVASNTNKIRLLNYIEKNRPISMSFRSWELYEYPILPTSTKNVWTVKTSNQLEKPRFVILGFQTNRKNQQAQNASQFDHCDISNVKLFLNSQYYPYGNLNLDINRYQYAVLYDMFANFQSLYYDKVSEPVVNKNDFISRLPLIVIDCSKQNESLKNAPVDVRLEFESRDNFPAGTSAYCLILHDRIVQYNPVSGDIKILI